MKKKIEPKDKDKTPFNKTKEIMKILKLGNLMVSLRQKEMINEETEEENQNEEKRREKKKDKMKKIYCKKF